MDINVPSIWNVTENMSSQPFTKEPFFLDSLQYKRWPFDGKDPQSSFDNRESTKAFFCSKVISMVETNPKIFYASHTRFLNIHQSNRIFA